MAELTSFCTIQFHDLVTYSTGSMILGFILGFTIPTVVKKWLTMQQAG